MERFWKWGSSLSFSTLMLLFATAMIAAALYADNYRHWVEVSGLILFYFLMRSQVKTSMTRPKRALRERRKADGVFDDCVVEVHYLNRSGVYGVDAGNLWLEGGMLVFGGVRSGFRLAPVLVEHLPHQRLISTEDFTDVMGTGFTLVTTLAVASDTRILVQIGTGRSNKGRAARLLVRWLQSDGEVSDAILPPMRPPNALAMPRESGGQV